MRIGIGLPAALPGVESSTLTRWAALAEQRGFDAIGVVDRVCYDNHEPLLVLAAAATVTERVELVTDSLIAPLRPTALLAKQAATLDRLSRGRLTLGVGIGGRADDYSVLELSPTGRAARLEYQLEQLRQFWSGTAIGPEPAQPGGPPILVAGDVPAAIERAARLGDGWTAGGGSLNQFKEGLAVFERAWRRYERIGRPRVLAMTYFALGEGAQAAAGDDLRHSHHWLGDDLSSPVAALALTDEDKVRSWLDSYRAAGADEVLLVPTDVDLSQVNLLAAAVASWRTTERVAASPNRDDYDRVRTPRSP